MTIQNIFSGGLELANALVNSDPLQQARNAIENHPVETSLYNVTKLPDSSCTIISFVASASVCCQIQGKQSLVDSSTDSTLRKFEFLCNKENPSFSVNEAAIGLFSQHFDQLDLLKTQLVEISKSEPTTSIIITGLSHGGCVATLFTFWLLQSLGSSRGKKRPLCITFGAPLLGDEQLRQCVSKLSTWNYCFLHVATTHDPTPKFFHHQGPSGVYPFGTFLLCSASGCACFEDPDFILEQLVTPNPHFPQNQDPHLALHYGQILENLKHKAICNSGFQCSGEERDPLQASIITQLQAIGVQQPNTEITSLLQRMKKHETKLLIQKKKISDSDKLLNQMKGHMALLEWYKKDSRSPQIGGYYDRYRNPHGNVTEVNVKEYKRKLMNYWEDSVTEVENKPQIEGAHLKTRWLWAGTNYRRMVEPLHIADYYKDGGKNYKTDGKRPRHFILLEDWLKQKDKPQEVPKQSKKQNVGASLNEDSCFWENVEEAVILCNLLKEGSVNDVEKEAHKEKLKEFVVYVWNSLKQYAVSPEIFLTESSFMQWWKKNKGFVESLGEHPCSLLLVDFMKNYKEYEEGTFTGS